MMHNIANPNAATGFAYCDAMIERLVRNYLFDINGSCEQVRGASAEEMEAYATARLCKILKTLALEGKIYNEEGHFTIDAVRGYLKSVADSYQQKHGFEPQKAGSQIMLRHFNAKIDYAFWTAAEKMQAWSFVS